MLGHNHYGAHVLRMSETGRAQKRAFHIYELDTICAAWSGVRIEDRNLGPNFIDELPLLFPLSLDSESRYLSTSKVCISQYERQQKRLSCIDFWMNSSYPDPGPRPLTT